MTIQSKTTQPIKWVVQFCEVAWTHGVVLSDDITDWVAYLALSKVFKKASKTNLKGFLIMLNRFLKFFA